MPCICNQNGYMECKPKSRLKVLLPQIRMAGFWRMETNSWNAVEELSAMEQALTQMQAYGILDAAPHPARAEHRRGTRKYVIPRLEFNETSQALIDGASTRGRPAHRDAPPGQVGRGGAAGAIGPGEAWEDAALDRRRQRATRCRGNDDIIDAEVVEEEVLCGVVDKGHPAKVRARMHATIAQVAKDHGIKADDLRHGMVWPSAAGPRRRART